MAKNSLKHTARKIWHRLHPSIARIDALENTLVARDEERRAALQITERRILPALDEMSNDLQKVREQINSVEKRIQAVERRLPQKPIRGPRDSLHLEGVSELIAANTSAEYLTNHMAQARRYPSHNEFLEACVRKADAISSILEFGVYSGRTIRILSSAASKETNLFGFDSFEGLPEQWRPGFVKGMFSVDELPDVPENVTLIKGLFEDTLPSFLEVHPGPFGLVHIDCDLYSSTRFVLEALAAHFSDGTILIFDEYFNFPGWRDHEFKAFQEFIAASSFSYDYIACVPGHQQVAVRLTQPQARA